MQPDVKSPPPPWFRWAVLVVMGLAMFGAYYVFDALYPVTPLLQKELGFSDQQVGLLDTSYNVAALLTLIAGGVLIDRIGTAKAAVLFGLFGAAGGVLIAVLPALAPGSPALGMAAGRFVLGIGSELFIVTATVVIGRWFKGKEIATALALQMFIARLGSYAADKSPDTFSGLFTGWQPPLLLAAASAVGWFLLAGLYAGLERVASGRFTMGQAATTDKLTWSVDLLRFNRAYWLVVGLCVAFYATIFPFRTFANLYFIDAHHVTPEMAGTLKSYLPLVSMFGMPLFGMLVDRVGHRALLMLVGSALLVPPFILMNYTTVPLAVSMGMLGLAFALVPAVLWPAVTHLVPDARLGSAYALMTFCQQVGWGAMSWGVGKANDVNGASTASPGGYMAGIWMFTILAALGFVCAFVLWRSERGASSHGLELAKPQQVA